MPAQNIIYAIYSTTPFGTIITSSSNGGDTGDFVMDRHLTGASLRKPILSPLFPAPDEAVFLFNMRMVSRVLTQWCQVGPRVGW